MAVWGIRYVENLTWVRLGGDCRPCQDRGGSPYFCTSHLTLLIGKRGSGPLELRHQRNCDVIVCPERHGEEMPLQVHAIIETLLPAERPPQPQSAPTAPDLLHITWNEREGTHLGQRWVRVAERAKDGHQH